MLTVEQHELHCNGMVNTLARTQVDQRYVFMLADDLYLVL